jgi:hypothetical protein
MLSQIIAALLLPFRNPVVFACLFWPAFVALVSANWLPLNLAVLYFGYILGFAFLVVLLCLLFLLMAPGLVGWHRWCVLDEPPGGFTVRIERLAFAYWRRLLVLNVQFLVVNLVMFAILYGGPILAVGLEAWSRMPELQLASALLAYLSASWIFVKLFGQNLLQLVAISVASKGRQIEHHKVRLAPLDAKFTKPVATIIAFSIILGMTAPAMIGLVVPRGLVGILGSFVWIYGLVAIAAFVSLYYRAEVHHSAIDMS